MRVGGTTSNHGGASLLTNVLTNAGLGMRQAMSAPGKSTDQLAEELATLAAAIDTGERDAAEGGKELARMYLEFDRLLRDEHLVPARWPRR